MKKRLIMPELFRGQRREVVCSQPDNQHISRSNVVDLALVGSQSAIQRELFQFSLLVDDDCGLVLPWINGFDPAADGSLQGFQPRFNLNGLGIASGFNQNNR